MTGIDRTTLRRATAGVLAALTAVAFLAIAPTADAVAPTTTERIAGENRYETAAAVALDAFPDGADVAVVATGEDFADALAASGIAGALDAPVLLTQTDTLTGVTSDALATLGVTEVRIMGGTAAVSQAVEDALAVDYEVSRIEGADRFETANAAADAVAATAGGTVVTPTGGIGSTDDGVTAFLVSGLTFPDAVSASPAAYAGSFPVLLGTRDLLPQATIDAIEDNGIEHVIIVGGTAVIGQEIQDDLETDLDVTTARLAGETRWFTNVAVAQFTRDVLDFAADTIYVATGTAFPDALTSGPAAAVAGNPLLLTSPVVVPTALEQFLEANAGVVDAIVAIGGTAAITADVLGQLAGLAQLDDNQAFDIEPATSESFPVSSSPLNSDGARTYTATGLDASTEHVIALLDPSVVSSQSGQVRISAYTLTDGPETSIESVNGTPTAAAAGSGGETVETTGDSNADGELTFTIDATASDQVIPVVYLDEDADGELDLVDRAPDEPFGLGGVTTWTPPEAADTTPGTARQVTVGTIDYGSNLFVAGGDTYFYAAGDVFTYDDSPATDSANTRPAPSTTDLAGFEGALSPGDILLVEYFSDSQSLFSFDQDNLSDLADVTAVSTGVASDGDDVVTVSWTLSDQPDVTYTVYADPNRNGTLTEAERDAGTPRGSTKGSSLTFDEGTDGTVRYVVVPTSTLTGRIDAPASAGDFAAPELRVGLGFELLPNGATVQTNAGLSTANQGDVIALRFTKQVTIGSGASITLSGLGSLGNNGTQSTWAADGSSILITLGSATNAAGATYPLTITGLSGVRDGNGSVFTLAGSPDTSVEDGGPELMGSGTGADAMPGVSTCNVGDTTCTLVFNEPVDEMTAETGTSYAMPNSGGNGVQSATLGTDGRTVTLTFNAALDAGSQIAPTGALAFPGVDDAGGTESTQPAFGFVLPA